MLYKALYFFLGPAAVLVLCIFCTGLAVRLITFLSHIIQSRPSGRKHGHKSWNHVLRMTGAACLPFQKAFVSQPAYTLLRYVFHACLFLVPLYESGHVILLQVKFGWYGWPSLPGMIIKIMTFFTIGAGLFFICRRVADSRVRHTSSITDFVIIMVSMAPFITGYLYANHPMNNFHISADTLLLLHVVSGETMLIMAVFLFIRTRLVDEKCVGCASCSTSCPTGTLEIQETGDKRFFFYSHYQCICCGNCVMVCPEKAAALRHQIGLNYFFSFSGKQKIREKKMIRCRGCNVLFAPYLQIEKIENQIEAAGVQLPQTLNYCSRCKKLFSSSVLLES